MHGLRQKKTDCPSVLKFTVSIPTKKDQRASLDHPYLVSHPSILQITFTHNHPIESAHCLSFRPIDLETKESFFKLFRMAIVLHQHIIGMKQNSSWMGEMINFF